MRYGRQTHHTSITTTNVRRGICSGTSEVEHRFTSNWLLSVFYTGAHGNNLLQSRFPLQSDQNIPATVQNSWNQIYAQSNGVTNPATQQVANPLQPTTGPLIPFQGQIRCHDDPAGLTLLPLFNPDQHHDAA